MIILYEMHCSPRSFARTEWRILGNIARYLKGHWENFAGTGQFIDKNRPKATIQLFPVIGAVCKTPAIQLSDLGGSGSKAGSITPPEPVKIEGVFPIEGLFRNSSAK